MARPTNAAKAAALVAGLSDDTPAPKGAVKITYCPRESGDPFETSTMGHRFKANVPKLIADKVVIEGLRGNRWFEIEGDPANTEKRRPIVRPKVRLEVEDEEDREAEQTARGLVGATAIAEKYVEVDTEELDPVDN